MDQDRQIRFVVPPFLLFLSMLWGSYLGGRDLSSILAPETAREILGVLAATAVAIVPLGFVISVLSITVLRLIAWLAGWPTYEAHLSPQAFARIWKQIGSPQVKDEALTLYAVATYDHAFLKPDIHTWLFRRWNAFNVAAHSAVALFLAHAISPFFEIPQTTKWWASTVSLVALLLVNAAIAWRDTMRMLEFQTTLMSGASEAPWEMAPAERQPDLHHKEHDRGTSPTMGSDSFADTVTAWLQAAMRREPVAMAVSLGIATAAATSGFAGFVVGMLFAMVIARSAGMSSAQPESRRGSAS
jgi:hypothetical protein